MRAKMPTDRAAARKYGQNNFDAGTLFAQQKPIHWVVNYPKTHCLE